MSTSPRRKVAYVQKINNIYKHPYTQKWLNIIMTRSRKPIPYDVYKLLWKRIACSLKWDYKHETAHLETGMNIENDDVINSLRPRDVYMRQ